MTAATPVVCPKCGQRADRRPGFRLTDAGADAVFVDDELAVLAPQYLDCLQCGHRSVVPGGSIEVRQP